MGKCDTEPVCEGRQSVPAGLLWLHGSCQGLLMRKLLRLWQGVEGEGYGGKSAEWDTGCFAWPV